MNAFTSTSRDWLSQQAFLDLQMDDLVDQLDRMDREGGARAQAMSSGAVPGNKHRDGDGRKLDDLVRPPSPSPPEELPFHDTSQYLGKYRSRQ